jgi:hypothetical protein
MAPTLQHLFTRRNFDPGATTAAFADEWSNPSNYAFTILLLVGGDLIHRALAQLVGGRTTPIAFSFGVYEQKRDRSFASFFCLPASEVGSRTRRPPYVPRSANTGLCQMRTLPALLSMARTVMSVGITPGFSDG